MWYLIKVLTRTYFPGGLAQLGERLPCKQEVTSPTGGAHKARKFNVYGFF